MEVSMFVGVSCRQCAAVSTLVGDTSVAPHVK
jgi:hypothetical protein